MVVQVQARWPAGYGPQDVITIGTGESGKQTGRYNTNSPSYGTLELLLAAVDASMPSVGGCTVKFLPGDYQFAGGGYAFTKAGVHVTGSLGANLINASSGALGCLSVSGARSRISDIKVTAANWVNSQKLLRVLGTDCSVKDVHVVGSAVGGNNITPMKALECSGASRVRVENPTILPMLGLDGISMVSSSNNFTIVNPNIGDFWTGAQRNSGTPFLINDSSHGSIFGGHVSGLGEVGNLVPYLMRVWNTNGTDHHLKVKGLECETLYATRGIQVEAGRHCHFEDVALANFPETTIGAFVVVDSTADFSGTAASSVHFKNCTMHEIGKEGTTTGGAFYIGKATKVRIRNCVNETALMRTVYADTDNTNDFLIEGLIAETSVSLSTAALYRGSGDVSSKRWVYRSFKVYNHTQMHSAPTGFTTDASNEVFT